MSKNKKTPPTAPKTAGTTVPKGDEREQDTDLKVEQKDGEEESPALTALLNSSKIVKGAMLTLTDKLVIILTPPSDAANIIVSAWQMAAAPCDIRLITPGRTIAETLEALIADDNTPDEFIFVPGICFPTRKLSLGDLISHRVCVFEKGTAKHNTGLPVALSKEHILSTFDNHRDASDADDETFMALYNKIAHAGVLPNTVSHHFGNCLVYASRADICKIKLIEAIHTKKFICLSTEALPAARRHLEEHVNR